MKWQWINSGFIGGSEGQKRVLGSIPAIFESLSILRRNRSDFDAPCVLFCEICHGHRPCRGRTGLARILRECL